MKAKCTHCCNGDASTCTKCNGTCEINVELASGYVWTRVCVDKACGFENGGYITKSNKEPKISSGECVKCGAMTKWVLIGVT